MPFPVHQAQQAFLIAHLVKKKLACIAEDFSSIPGSGRSAGEGIGYPLHYSWASLIAQLVKNPPAMRETRFDPWVGKIPYRRETLPTSLFWPGEFHGLYSPWGRKESDTTERLSLSLSSTLSNKPLEIEQTTSSRNASSTRSMPSVKMPVLAFPLSSLP